MDNTAFNDSASPTPVTMEFIHAFLGKVIKTGCDRIPLKVRNLPSPFYLAGADQGSVYLIHAETCMVSQFSYQDLETLSERTIADISELTMAWLRSAEHISAQEMTEAAKSIESAGKRLPVTLRWPHLSKSRVGALTLKSASHGASDTAWIIGVEAAGDNSVCFRYGITRLGQAMHDCSKLTMALKPGTPY
ncbi:hypothetical protein ACI77O_12285 [Pseudomonas tritici]|uniref:hypothetical protein n=1 Tax=Pseudomonas tritici TaxID=2745518 RepID=UPI00387ACB11